MNKITHVYEFRHNDDTNDSAAFTVSIHRTKKGAVAAMKTHKLKAKLKFDEEELWWKENYPSEAKLSNKTGNGVNGGVLLKLN